jgi:hypothetical protein
MNSQRGLSGAFRDVTPDQQDDQAEDDAEREAHPPADVDGQLVGRGHGDQGPGGRPRPVGAVDDDVDAPAVPAGDQLVNGRVDGRVLAADAESGQEPEEEEPPGRERKGRAR